MGLAWPARWASGKGYGLLSAPRGQRAALVGDPELVQAAEGFAVDDDLGEAGEPRDTGKLGLEFWVLCQIDLFERYAPLRQQRLRVDAEGAGAGGEEDDAAWHVDEYKLAFQYSDRCGESAPFRSST